MENKFFGEGLCRRPEKWGWNPTRADLTFSVRRGILISAKIV